LRSVFYLIVTRKVLELIKAFVKKFEISVSQTGEKKAKTKKKRYLNWNICSKTGRILLPEIINIGKKKPCRKNNSRCEEGVRNRE